jgi:hypothetical protein
MIRRKAFLRLPAPVEFHIDQKSRSSFHFTCRMKIAQARNFVYLHRIGQNIELDA